MFDDKRKRDHSDPMHIRLKGDNRFEPGDTLSGMFDIFPDQTIACRGITLKIGWRTEGKGRRDEQILLEEHYGITELTADKTYAETFEVTLPHAPYSYAGHHINIVWFVSVKVDRPLAFDLNAEQRFILRPAGASASAVEDDLPLDTQ